MLRRLKDECELAVAIYEASPKLQITTWIWLLSPTAALLLGWLVLGDVQQKGGTMLKPALATMGSAIFLVAFAVFVKFGAAVVEIYMKERRRVLYG